MYSWQLILTAVLALAAISASKKRVVCYYGSWAVYRPGKGMFDVENIDPKLCTHHVYSFVGITSSGGVKVLDAWNDLPDDGGKNGFSRFVALKKKNANAKMMVAIGGWSEGSEKFSQVVNDDDVRKKFVKNAVAFLQKHKFDGLDVDWEYPTQRGGEKSDKGQFVTLLKELHEAFKSRGYVLSVAVGSGTDTVHKAYDVKNIAKYVDMINVMTYDVHESGEGVLGENAPLHASAYDKKEGDTTNNVAAQIENFIKLGAPASKLNMGMGTYGRSYTASSSKHTNIGDPSSGAGKAGAYTDEAGMLGYNEICENIKSHGWTEHWEKDQEVPYATKGNQWVGYDNVKSIDSKCQYIVSKGLGGAMIWSIDTDDFGNHCGGGKYPLLTEINRGLKGK